MSYTGLLPTGDAFSTGLGASEANFIPNTPKEVAPKYAAYFNDWVTPLIKAGLNPITAGMAATAILMTPSNLNSNSMQFICNAQAIRGALKSRGYPVTVSGVPFERGGIEDQVLTRQFSAKWPTEMTWGALLLGALAAPSPSSPSANAYGLAALTSNLPLLIGAGVVAFFMFKKGK